MVQYRKLVFFARARRELEAFPAQAVEEALAELGRVQAGLQPHDWKPMKTIGAGVREIRLRDETGAYRVIYFTKLKDAIYVLHCFKKQSQKTSVQNLGVATARFKQLVRGTGRF